MKHPRISFYISHQVSKESVTPVLPNLCYGLMMSGSFIKFSAIEIILIILSSKTVRYS